jgi:peptidylprolyl isomerase
MRSRFSLLPVAAALAVTLPAQAQTTTPKPAAPAAHASTTTAASAAAKLPPGVLPAHGIMKTSLALKYQDIKLGTGPLGKEQQMWHVKYKGWRAADGVVFDAWDQHPQPVIGPDGKPVMGPDKKPQMGEPQPLEFPHGVGRMIPGFDLAVEGMRVGGKRRIYVPWALAYGYRAMPDRGPDHPGIPAKSDLVFDVELVSVSDMPPPPPMPARPGLPGMSPGQSGNVPKPGQPGTPGQPAAPGQPSAPATAPAPAPATAPGSPAPPPATTTPAPQPKPTTPPPGQ